MVKFTKLNIGDSVASSNSRVWKKLSAESTGAQDELAGTWVFKAGFYDGGIGEGTYYLNFTNGDNYSGTALRAVYEGMGYTISYLEWGEWRTVAVGSTVNGTNFYDDSDRTINITSKLAEVSNGDVLLTWLLTHATKQGATNLITFTIAGTSYQAEEGMTWGEWVESDYNTDGFVYHAGSLCTSLLNYHVVNTGGSSATITEGTNYSMSPYGGGN